MHGHDPGDCDHVSLYDARQRQIAEATPRVTTSEPLDLFVGLREPGPSDEQLTAAIAAAVEPSNRTPIKRGDIKAWLMSLPDDDTPTPPLIEDLNDDCVVAMTVVCAGENCVGCDHIGCPGHTAMDANYAAGRARDVEAFERAEEREANQFNPDGLTCTEEQTQVDGPVCTKCGLLWRIVPWGVTQDSATECIRTHPFCTNCDYVVDWRERTFAAEAACHRLQSELADLKFDIDNGAREATDEDVEMLIADNAARTDAVNVRASLAAVIDAFGLRKSYCSGVAADVLREALALLEGGGK